MIVSVKRYDSAYTLYDNAGQSKEYSDAVPHTWLHGDTVNPDSGVIIKRAATHKNLVGIVDYVNRTGMGFTPRNIPLYLWYPLDTRYPPMLVSSKDKPTTNQIVTVMCEHWDDKRPRAGITARIGDVGNIEVELHALRIRTTPILKPPTILSAYPIPDYATYETIVWDRVFHIDPLGCEDVDDIIAWRAVDAGYEFAIGIADVAAWVTPGSAIDIYAATIGQTIYTNGAVTMPMLPTSLSSNVASLRADGNLRPVLALCFTVTDGVIVSQTWRRLVTTIHTCFTYDSVYADTEVCAKVTAFVKALCGRCSGDSHDWIAELMIAYNKEAGSLLRLWRCGILRAHSGITNTEWSELAAKTGCKELAWFGSAAGRFVRADGDDVAHNGLGAAAYATASSPLRRYADLVNQRILVHRLFGIGDANPAIPCEPWQLNERARIVKHYERDLWFLTNLRTDTITEVHGIVVRMKADSVWVYVGIWKRMVKIRIETTTLIEIGTDVLVRAFTNLRATSFEHRIVCSINL